MNKKMCFDYALSYINRFPKTSSELILQLRKKGYDEAEIQESLARLRELNYVNDLEFTRLYLNSEVSNKGKPLFKVKGKLMQKGIEKDMIRDVEEELEEDLQAGMKQKIAKEIELLKNRDIDGVKIIQKLQGRGYSFDLIKEVVEERAEEC